MVFGPPLLSKSTPLELLMEQFLCSFQVSHRKSTLDALDYDMATSLDVDYAEISAIHRPWNGRDLMGKRGLQRRSINK